MLGLSCVVVLALAAVSNACVFKYGDDPNDPTSIPLNANIRFNYSFAGADWPGLCATGDNQTPINIPEKWQSFTSVRKSDQTIMDFGKIKSNGSNIELINLENVIQVQWNVPDYRSGASVAVPSRSSVLLDALTSRRKKFRARLTPVQFHFHTHSEHSIEGVFYPAEAHIVCQVKSDVLPKCTGDLGCLAVIGIMFKIDDKGRDNQFLKPILDSMPSWIGRGIGRVDMPKGFVLDFDKLLPKDRTYVTYTGSLTTPPCLEGLLWHVLTEPLTMSVRQLEQMMTTTGDVSCPDGPSGSRDLMKCKQLGAGQNYRILQPVGQRTLRTFSA